MFFINTKIVFTKKRYLLTATNLIPLILIIIFVAQNKNKKIKKTKTYLNQTMAKKQEQQKIMC